MSAKRQLGIVLTVAFLAAFLFWSVHQSGIGTGLRSLVGGLLAGGAALSWAFLVRKRPSKKP